MEFFETDKKSLLCVFKLYNIFGIFDISVLILYSKKLKKKIYVWRKLLTNWASCIFFYNMPLWIIIWLLKNRIKTESFLIQCVDFYRCKDLMLRESVYTGWISRIWGPWFFYQIISRGQWCRKNIMGKLYLCFLSFLFTFSFNPNLPYSFLASRKSFFFRRIRPTPLKGRMKWNGMQTIFWGPQFLVETTNVR